jgi:hypothetical protein
MEQKEMMSSRADAARRVSILMLNPSFHRDLARQDVLDDEGEISMVIAGSDESAIIAIHRMERVKSARVVLATTFDDRVHVLYMKTEDVSEPSHDVVDVVGGMTVRDWLEMIRINPGRTYHASGSDVMSAVDASEYAVA